MSAIYNSDNYPVKVENKSSGLEGSTFNPTFVTDGVSVPITFESATSPKNSSRLAFYDLPIYVVVP
jgi:hypothetical protein